jgi:hypothetical protein
MRRAFLLLGVVALAGCAKAADRPAVDTTTVAPPPPPPPPSIALSDVAGKWKVEVKPETGDSVVATYELVATADTSGWQMVLPKGQKVPMQVAVSGDSLLVSTGQFASMVRKGKKVSSTGVMRLQGGRLVGHTTGHYVGAGADSVANYRIEGTRVQ